MTVMAQVFCSECGAKLVEARKFCPACGAAIPVHVQPDSLSTQARDAQLARAQVRVRRAPMVKIVAIAAVFIVAAGGAGYWLYSQGARQIKDCSDCAEMVIIRSGSFQMGLDEHGERPVHAASVRAFAIGKTEVTQAQWKSVMGSNPSKFAGCDDCPVEQITWYDIQEFIKKLNAKTGRQYRLPSEAEWEYACKAGGSYKYCGGDDVNAVAWYGRQNTGSVTHPVAQKQPNAWGLYDMSGNVWEWTQDCSHLDPKTGEATYRGAPNDGSAWVTECDRFNFRVTRGGSIVSGPADATFRAGQHPAYGDSNVGFRLARELRFWE